MFWLIALFIILPACIGLSFVLSLGRWQIGLRKSLKVDEDWRQKRIADVRQIAEHRVRAGFQRGYDR